jgi:hypothetical protein
MDTPAPSPAPSPSPGPAPGPGPGNPHGFRVALSPEETVRLPLRHFEGAIHVVNSEEEAGLAVSRLMTEQVLGFDTETRAAFRRGESYLPALVQLAGADGVWLFRLRPMGGPGALVPLLSSPAVIKAGVALDRDIRELQGMARFVPAGFVELGELADECGVPDNGLRGLAVAVLGLRVSKSAQRSNWDCPQLSGRQVEYAATDAWVCREVYLRLRAAGAGPGIKEFPAAGTAKTGRRAPSSGAPRRRHAH